MMTSKQISSLRNRINSKLNALPNYSEYVPLDDVMTICSDNQFQAVDEDLLKWSGFLCGSEGRCSIPLSDATVTVEESYGETFPKTLKLALQVTWYRMPSGNFETVCYVA